MAVFEPIRGNLFIKSGHGLISENEFRFFFYSSYVN